MTAEQPASPAHGQPANALLAAAPTWRRQPYRAFFTLGFVLAWAGVLHWLLFALGVLPEYRPVFHATVQIQGFMMCFAVGFLFTAIPRRTGTAPPSTWEMTVGLIAPAGTAISAWLREWAVAQAFWLLLVATLVVFASGRFRSRSAGRRPPPSFVWIPISLAMGIAGSSLVAIGGAAGATPSGWYELGRLLVLQGVFLGLVVGVGGMVLPLLTRGESSRDAGPADRKVRVAQALAALALILTFVVEIHVSRAAGYALRSALCLVLLLSVARIHRLPDQPGWHRLAVWLAAWLIPIGYAVAAVWPVRYQAGLHVVFLGGFALMAFSVGMHVVLAHGGYQHLVRGRPWQVPVFVGLLLIALGCRILAQFQPERFVAWLGAASAAYLVATLAWAALVLTRIARAVR